MRPQRQLARRDRSRGAACRQQRLGRLASADRRDREPRPRSGTASSDQLPRHAEPRRGKTVRRLSWRATSVAQRRFQRRDVERARQPHAPAGCCRSRSAPSSRSRNHSRRCANDSGISAGRAHRDAAPAAPPAPGRALGQRRRRSAPRTGCGSRARRPSVERMRRSAGSPAASGRRARRSCRRCRPARRPAPRRTAPHRISSCGVRGARARARRRRRPAPAAPCGRACRWASAAAVQHHEGRRHHVVRQARRNMRRAAPPHRRPRPRVATT